jgi:DNA replication protein DnaC
MSACPEGLCDGSGFLLDEAARVARPCRCRPARMARKRAAALAGRIPRRYREVSFDREPLPSIERVYPGIARDVRRYVRDIDAQLDAGKGLWFTGVVGSGKTTLAMLVSKAALEAERTVAIYSLPRLLAVLRESFADDAQYSLSQIIDQLSSVDLLHLDDVGAEQTTPWVLEQLYSIVNARYEDGRSMLVTTNLITLENDDALREQIGDRTVSRLYEMCGEPMHMHLGDQRRVTYELPDIPEREPARAAWDDEPPAYGEPRPRPARWAS